MQLVELQEAREQFLREGLGLAAVTYDNEATLREFAAAHRISYPLLADPASRIIRSFGVLDPDNTDFNRAGDGSAMPDMAYPGYFVIDPNGVVVEKFFEEIYSDRHTPNNVFGQLFPELLETGGPTLSTPHLALRLGQSDAVAALGNRVTLFVEVELPPGIHVYGPGAPRPYHALELKLDPPSPFETCPARYPAAEVVELPAIHESLPVFEGRFRVQQDVVVPGRDRKFRRSLRDAPDQSLTVTIPGTLRYQACDRSACYRPKTMRFSWSVKVRSNPAG